MGDSEVIAWANGRVNLIGEHTDYNEGFVLPLAIPQRTTVRLTARSDGEVDAHSAEQGDGRYTIGQEEHVGAWVDYVQGATWALREAGHPIGGFTLHLRSDVPLGSGLSSSAALLVAVLRGLRALFGLTFDDAALVLLAHRAETAFVGVPVGLLDPMACTFATEDHALFIDTRTLAAVPIAVPDSLRVVVVDSGQRHEHASGAYRERRAECAAAAKALGVGALRDCDPTDLPRIAALPAPLDRRARHVVTENQRVLDTVDALRAADAGRLGRLLDASHASQRDDFECSTPQIDRLVAVARGVPGVRGARLTGGGFGGSVVLLADAVSAVAAARETVRRAAGFAGLAPRVLVPDLTVDSDDG